MNQTKTIEERLERLEQDHYELTENVYGALGSIVHTLKKIKEDYYEKAPEGSMDELDISIEEIETNIGWIDKLMNPDEDEEE